jgi:glycosyltransferase involved in cell wall biosynthesis
MKQIVVMVTSSYPRFPGDSVGTFMEPIAKGIAARGHEVHLVAPWHPRITRGREEDGVFFHFFRYAPVRALNVFGYAAGMRADERLRLGAWAVAPLAMAAGWFKTLRVAQKQRATLMHAHWVVPGGVIAAAARPQLPLVVSLHGSDVFVAERVAPARAAARRVFRRAALVTACSADLATRAVALGAAGDRMEVIPYGVDADRFHRDPGARSLRRAQLRLPPETPLIVAAGRLVRKKGFEYLIDAAAHLEERPTPAVVIAGEGDLGNELRARAMEHGIAGRVHFLGNLPQGEVAAWFAAADAIALPSVRDDRGNVDGLPNTVLEALASATPLVTTGAGGIGAVAEHNRTALVVPQRDSYALASALDSLLANPARAEQIGKAGRAMILARFGWPAAAARFDAAYDRALAFKWPDR